MREASASNASGHGEGRAAILKSRSTRVWPTPVSWFDNLAARSLPWVPRPLVGRLSSRYIAGLERDDALRVGATLDRSGYHATYDLLGEAVQDMDAVQSAAKEYLRLLEELAARGLGRNVSLKPTQMGLSLSENGCFDTVAQIAGHAQRLGAFLRFEMEDSSLVDSTLRVYARLRTAYPGVVGCVLQSMLRRTEEDACKLVAAGGPLNVRLVKGIYVEPPELAYQDADEVRESWKRTLRVLLEGGAFVAAATHDQDLAEAAVSAREERPEWRDRVEIQMLLGVREEMRANLRDRGLPVRVYVPYGPDWYPYVLRRLRKNPKLARYALLGLFSKRESMD